MIFSGLVAVSMKPIYTVLHASYKGHEYLGMTLDFYSGIRRRNSLNIHIQGATDPVLTLVRPLFVSPEASLFEPGMVYPYSPLSAISKSPLARIEVLPDEVGGPSHPLVDQSPFIGLTLEFLDDPSGINFS